MITPWSPSLHDIAFVLHAGGRHHLREELLAFVQTFFPLLRTQTLQTRATGVEHGPRRKPDSHKIVPVLPGKDEIVLPAVETPAEEGAAIIDRASRSTEIHALTVRLGGEQKYRLPRRLIRRNAMPVRLHLVALFRVEEKTLITSAALGAPVAGYVSLAG
jgi:hypothetical protein